MRGVERSETTWSRAAASRLASLDTLHPTFADAKAAFPRKGGRGPSSPPNKRLEFPCFASKNRDSANFRLFAPLKRLNYFPTPPNFQKHFFGRFVEFQRVAREKAWKSRFSGDVLANHPEKQDRRGPASSQDFVRLGRMVDGELRRRRHRRDRVSPSPPAATPPGRR
jgi:hypothetical protein